MRTYDIKDVGSDYMPHRELVEDTEFNDGDWVRAEDAKKLIKAAYAEGFSQGFTNGECSENYHEDMFWNESEAKKELGE